MEEGEKVEGMIEDLLEGFSVGLELFSKLLIALTEPGEEGEKALEEFAEDLKETLKRIREEMLKDEEIS